jgi:hypothetical protein
MAEISDMSSGDTINISGSTNVNVKSTLTNMEQTVSAMPLGILQSVGNGLKRAADLLIWRKSRHEQR